MFDQSEEERTRRLMNKTPGWDKLAAALELDDDTIDAILGEASKLASEQLNGVGLAGDAEGCQLIDGRVVVPDCYHPAFAALAEGGWQSMDLPESVGGQGLPTALHCAASIFFEGEAMAFMMSASRPAAHLILEFDAELAAQWLPRLAAGEWATTICISEPDAGSDVARIRTRATKQGNQWRVTGTKCWISFGDHNLTSRIGHCILARTGNMEEGTRGLSLFLVPDRHVDGTRNGVSVSRIEEKLGIHGSPTCVMNFENAEATLLGEEGRGIQQMFRMIELMRLQTACQGLGVAQRATRLSIDYANERRQGGKPDKAPLHLIEHADVRRQLMVMAASTEVLRALVLEVSVLLDQARAGDEAAEQLAAFLLPLAKNFGGETAFSVASGAIQVFGGAGYTREWPVEQLLRDARVITIYEGTTGMQAQDFLHRRLLRDDGKSLGLFLARARAEVTACKDAQAATKVASILDQFEMISRGLLSRSSEFSSPDIAADGYLKAGWIAVSAAMVLRLLESGSDLEKLAHFRLHQLNVEMDLAEANCKIPANLI